MLLKIHYLIKKSHNQPKLIIIVLVDIHYLEINDFKVKDLPRYLSFHNYSQN